MSFHSLILLATCHAKVSLDDGLRIRHWQSNMAAFMTRVCLLLALLNLTRGFLPAQNLVPNSSFETGNALPTAWEFGASGVAWETFGHAGERGISLTGLGSAVEFCRTVASVPVITNLPYVLRFWGMTTNAVGSGAAANLEGAGGRRVMMSEQWSPYALVLVTPASVNLSRLSLNQSGTRGAQFLDEVEVRPAVPVHVRFAGRDFGAGERMRTNQYRFETRFQEFSGSYSRCLYQHTSQFGADEWSGFWNLAAPGFVTYRHALAGMTFTNARVKATVGFSFGGDLVVEASTNGTSWQELGRRHTSFAAPAPPLEVALPAMLLPAETLFVRLSATSNLYVSNYEFEAEVPAGLPNAEGATWFWEVQAPGELAQPVAMTNTPTGHELTLGLRNPEPQAREFTLGCWVEGPTGPRERLLNVSVPAFTTNEVVVPLPNAGVGENMAHLEIRETATQAILGSGALRLVATTLQEDNFGFLLPAPAGAAIWWCGNTYKVARERALPSATNEAVQIYAARNEYEPFQIVLRPDTVLSNVSVQVSDFVAPQLAGAPRFASSNVEIALVEYVTVTRPTDSWGAPGDYPDPLVPLSGVFTARAQANQPLWFTVRVPKHAPAGDYEATVNFQAPGFAATVPVRLRVFDFALSDTTHNWTAYHAEIETAWHKPDQQRRTPGGVGTLPGEFPAAPHHSLRAAFVLPDRVGIHQWTVCT